ncbi:MarR family winged helix-turn-helix transcriptional regulator [Algoriphagus sp. A40]|uniref:MarR family winged helix-turn-helix transcriptional regulator n=1 Tax=Algoriphagus sp. A40 TaxID=1945863 RepID=UPI000986C42B|nr:MarR family transcriptional regulator [Algoriphagus sp. A40]OOG70464.1 MarR family transcriptional regulator [Algoriphagus sp. A40]
MANTDFPSIRLSQALYTTSRLLIQQIQSKLNEFGLTYPQFLVMLILWENDGLKVHQLGEKLSLDSGTLTPLLKKLESQNILKRKRGEADERTVTIHLTYPGKSLQVKTLEAIAMLEEQLEIQLGKETQKLLPGMEDFLDKLKALKI